MMKNRQEIEGYVTGDVPLPATFSTGYKRDLDTAREMVRVRRGAEPATVETDRPMDNPTDTLELQYS